jgi:NhaP-type Na+/H+ or K+/H+ antiporter
MQEGVALGVLCVLFGGVLAQWVAWRVRIPAIVLLFALGLLLGPGLGVLHPSATFGRFLQPAVGLAVAIVVFEGGLALDLREWRSAGEGVLRLTAVALPLNWVLGALAAHFLGRLGWGPSVLFGAITVVTGPTVVLPLLRHTKLQRRAAAFLRWEAILNDPVGAILATLVLQVLLLQAKVGASGFMLVSLLPRLLLGLVVAVAAGILPALLVRAAFARDQMPEVLKTPVLLTLALVVCSVCNIIMEGAGLMAATVFGMALANLRVPGLSELRRFKESLVVLMVSALFILLTADLDRAVLARLSWPIVLLTLAILFVVRPLAIAVATARSSLSGAERLLAAWIAPRGIVAAAVAGVAGLRLQEAGYPTASLVMPAVFGVIAATMILHGFTLQPLARRLRLTLSDTPGLAILGASPWTTDLATALDRAGVPVLLVDTFPGALDEAREAGLLVLQAEILSQHGVHRLEDSPVDYLIAATPDPTYNGLVCARLAPEIGRERVFQLSPGAGRLDGYRGYSRDARGKVLGEEGWDAPLFARLFVEGWRFEVTPVPEAATPDESPPAVPDGLLLLIVRASGALAVPSAEDVAPTLPLPGDRLVAMRRPGMGARPDA